MADEKKPEGKPGDKPAAAPATDPFVEIVWMIISLLVALYLINGFFSFLGSLGLGGSSGGSWFNLGNSTQKTISLSKAPSLIGGKVETNESTAVYAEPGVNQIATKPAGSKATILEGPIIKDGEKYWRVRFDDGTEGWVAEDSLNYLKTEKKPLSQMDNPKEGDRVSVSKVGTAVYAEPGENQIAIKDKNIEGEIVGGPVVKDGVKYWKVHFDDGTEGWVAEDNLDSIKTKSVPLSSMPTIIGGKVLVSRNGTAIYDSPGGDKIGTVKKGTKGTIIEGPITKNGVKYWHIKFDNGQDGWVAEGDLEYIEKPESNIILKIIDWFKTAFLIFKIASVSLSLIFIGWIVYLYNKLVALRTDEVKRYYLEDTKTSSGSGELRNADWDKVLKNVESTNDSDLRLAILEADIMLGTLLDNMGLPGDTIGDKLKAVEKSDFTTVDKAWEAHKIRNQVAHEGVSFALSQHEAKRVIALYQDVFEEFRII